MKLAVCMAVYGHHELTTQVLAQIEGERDVVDVYLCDNAGDFDTAPSWVYRLTPGRNLGWLAGTNHCWREALRSSNQYAGFVLLNNDVVLSPHFFKNMITSLIQSTFKIGILGPVYDDCHRFQYRGHFPAADYVSTDRLLPVPYVDGTCMLVTKEAAEQLGMLDEEHFGFFGWGGDIDYCIRVRRAGFTVAVTEQVYINHLGRATANQAFENYKTRALLEFRLGMTKKYGRFWGRFQETGSWRRALTALRSFITSSRLFLYFAMKQTGET